ncbi:MAG: putative DNA binding domain-containing protein [Thermomicrobiales bacterium]
MPLPLDVFEHPEQHWSFLTASSDVDFEGQHFDRKEACRVGPHGSVNGSEVTQLRQQIKESLSAFSNANMQGGLLVLGITKKGEVKGIRHLSENQRNSLSNVNDLLINQDTRVRIFDCTDDEGNPNQICLLYVGRADRGICETPGTSPKAWRRHGIQNVPLSDSQRNQLRRDMRLLDWEQDYCCPYDPADVEPTVLREFRQVFLSGAAYEYSDQELLYQAGAIRKDRDGHMYFTNAGLLFFGANPQRVLPSAFIRLVRFDTVIADASQPDKSDFERAFTGPLPHQIRHVRTFLKESGFFKTYQIRNVNGGFIDEPEYPPIAIDEAIVNSVAHRDYAVKLPIECFKFRDAFAVTNPGRVLQRDQDVPERFSLDTTVLDHSPRNPKLEEWLKMMRDEGGTAFVRALSEGTKRMQLEMTKYSLPAPTYDVTSSQTKVTLLNEIVRREALLQAASVVTNSEFANLFPLTLSFGGDQDRNSEVMHQRRNEFLIALKEKMAANGWYIDSLKFGKIVAHRQGADLPLPRDVMNIVRFFPAYVIQIRDYWSKWYLCLDYTLVFKNVLRVRDLLPILTPDDLVGKSAIGLWRGWQSGRILSVDSEWTTVRLFDFEREERIDSSKVIPDLPKELIEKVLQKRGVRFDLNRAIKQHGLALEPAGARIRAERMERAATILAQSIFPLEFHNGHAILHDTPEPLSRRQGVKGSLNVISLPEPSVEFNHHLEATDIREGITRYGAFSTEPKKIELIPICTHDLRENMASLIDRLKVGRFKYRGSERTFSTRLAYSSIVTVPSPEAIPDECSRLLREHPEWIGDAALNRLFLVHTPEKGYSADDEQKPYYRVKRLLLEKGIPCQMIDTQTLLNPDWKELNLVLNISAKCGVTPWVLPDRIPDADFFVGLSYTQSRRSDGARLMGYANVFNEYGRWEFYAGNTESFPYEDRAKQFHRIVLDTLLRLSLSETPSIVFHYSAKFSQEDRQAILAAARSVRPQGTYSFVWINTHNGIRLYDSRPEGDGSLSRGSFVTTTPNQIILSTTGNNPFRKALGTPHMLEVSIRVERPEGAPTANPDLKALAVQILNLTKLNWASTDSLCAEPITTKYAGDIAYLTAAFLRQSAPFTLHEVLETTPWFI